MGDKLHSTRELHTMAGTGFESFLWFGAQIELYWAQIKTQKPMVFFFLA